MAEIDLVIRIPRKVYKAICDKNALGCDIGDIKNIIRNGTPLPKGHGRLIDADKILSETADMECNLSDEKDKQSVRFLRLEMESADVVIEADKKENICDTNPFNDTRFGG